MTQHPSVASGNGGGYARRENERDEVDVGPVFHDAFVFGAVGFFIIAGPTAVPERKMTTASTAPSICATLAAMPWTTAGKPVPVANEVAAMATPVRMILTVFQPVQLGNNEPMGISFNGAAMNLVRGSVDESPGT